LYQVKKLYLWTSYYFVPLDKMPDSEEFVPTHRSTLLHKDGYPLACIIDKNAKNALRYANLVDDPTLQASLTGFLNKHDELGLLMGFKLAIKTNDDFFEFIVYPNEEFIDIVIFNEAIFIINEKLDNLFYLKKIVTDQFVKTLVEFKKFQKQIK